MLEVISRRPCRFGCSFDRCVPRYGYHLDEHRSSTHHFEVRFAPRTLSDWGALGAVIGRKSGSYWATPYISGLHTSPTSDELKHFGAALASYGSVPLFHIEGITPEASTHRPNSSCDQDAISITYEDIRTMYAMNQKGQKIDVVVFAAPQLSLFEIQDIVTILDGRKVNESTKLFVATSPEIKFACDRFGITEKLKASEVMLLSGVCFYQMYARELRLSNSWTTLLSNSAKLVNIILGYGYEPFLGYHGTMR